MEKLPQELINRIVWFAERYPGADKWCPTPGQYFEITDSPSQFPCLATLDRSWKEAVETITFRELELKSDELGMLQSMVTGKRRNYLSKVSFTAMLPEYSDEACRRPETSIEQRANDKSFTKAIVHLFAVIKSWEDDGVQNALRIVVQSPASPTDSRADALRCALATRERIDILLDRWENSCLHLLNPTNLPTLSNVEHIILVGNDSRELDACIAPDLVMRLPNLRTFECTFSDCTFEPENDANLSDDDALILDSDSASDSGQEPPGKMPRTHAERSANRLAFATKLQNIACAPGGSANISFYHEFPIDQTLPVPSLLPPGYTYGPFSSALRVFSQNLSSLTISAHVDSGLFWPSPSDPNTIIPSWPNLKKLHINFNTLAPNASWYFTGPIPQPTFGNPDTDDDDLAFLRSRFRIHPDRETFDPFLSSFAKAVCNMPVLEYFMLECELMDDTGRLHIMYTAPGKKAEWGDQGVEDEGKRRVYYACEIGRVWVPEVDTAEKLRKAGEEKFGGEIVERWIGSLYI